MIKTIADYISRYVTTSEILRLGLGIAIVSFLFIQSINDLFHSICFTIVLFYITLLDDSLEGEIEDESEEDQE